MPIERRSSDQIIRKRKLENFMTNGNIIWKKRHSFTSDYDVCFINIYSPVITKRWKFFKHRKVIAEIYFASSEDHIKATVYDINYEE